MSKILKIILFMILILVLIIISIIIVWKNKVGNNYILINNFKNTQSENLITINTYNVNYLPFSENKNVTLKI